MLESKMPNVLFVCSGNSERSPSAEKLFQNFDGKWQTKSAGTAPSPGRNPLTQALVDWADMILAMQPEHTQHIHAGFKCEIDKVNVLGIDDIYDYGDSDLVRELKRKVTPVLRSYWNPSSMGDTTAVEDLWYFAYGSNLDPAQLRKRIGVWNGTIKCILGKHRLVFNVYSPHWRGHTANILATGNPNDKVYGVKYRISKQQLDRLTEQYEHVDPRYVGEIKAFAYCFQVTLRGARPSPEYLDTLVRGLISHGYGNDVVDEIRKIAGN
jgi:predicted protein tyrosine phosphatase